jgi:two-component system, OmpR family, alkaline phosphatase synthesis response regulator PhoP
LAYLLLYLLSNEQFPEVIIYKVAMSIIIKTGEKPMISKCILIVDDEKEVGDVLKRIINRFGYMADVASGSSDAIKKMKDERYCIIITDLSMPGMDGFELCKNIKEREPKSIVYALSGYIDNSQAAMLEKNGFDGYLQKPVNTITLHKAIDGAYERVVRSIDHPV